jgi:predicted ferric reductase
MKFKRLLWLLFYIIGAIIPSIFYVIKSININSDFSFLLSGILGVTAYYLLSVQFLLMSRPKLIDKYFSLDRVYRYHMFIAVIALIVAYLHVIFKGIYFEDSLQTAIGNVSLIIFVVITVFSILLMVNKLFFRIKAVDSLRKFFNNAFKLKYENKILIHNIMVFALIILFAHVLMSSSINSNLPLKIAMIIYFIIPLGLYLNHKIIKVHFNKDKKYVVSDIVRDAKNIVTIKFSNTNGKVFDYLPGQFLYVRIYNPNIPRDEHPFTISSSPLEKEYVAATIKQIGDFTSSLSKAKVGDRAYIDGGFGSFSYLKRPSNKKLCFIAGGIGITPFLGMLRYIFTKDNNREVVLLWGVRDESEIICKYELEEYTSLLKNFKFIPIVSNDDTYKGEKGFIDPERLKSYANNISQYDFYICGPPIMMEAQLNNLRKLGVPKENIHFERFSL